MSMTPEPEIAVPLDEATLEDVEANRVNPMFPATTARGILMRELLNDKMRCDQLEAETSMLTAKMDELRAAVKKLDGTRKS